MNYGWRFVTLYRRQGSTPSPIKINAKREMVVWGDLTNSCEKKRSERQKRKGKIYPFEFRIPKIARRDKAFLSDQCKEIEENNRMGKTRNLFKKMADTKGTFYAKMVTKKDRNVMDLTEADDIKKRWQEYTEELYRKDLHDPDNHNSMISHLEPDILECEVRWALGSITTNKGSGGDGICNTWLYIYIYIYTYTGRSFVKAVCW